MKLRLTVATMLLVTGVAAQGDLRACGDKFLVVSRGTRFQLAVARTTAAILIYANPASNLPRALANLPIDDTLRKAGHKPTTVTTAAAFDAALGRGGWDLVLVDAADSRDVSTRLAADRASAVVLPVVYNTTAGQLAEVTRQYQCVLKSPTKNQSFLDKVDEALSLKPRPRGKIADKVSD
jgi:hypothetical protein